MTDLYFGNKRLVTRSYKEEDIFFLIYFITIILFLIKKILKKILLSDRCQCGLLYNLCATGGIQILAVDLWDH